MYIEIQRTAVLHGIWRLDFIIRVSHGRRSQTCSIWGCHDLRGHHGIARRMPVSFSGPREDISLKALGGYAPLALQTDILPRSRVGDTYSTLCCGVVQYLIDEFTVHKNNNKVLEDKAEKVETAVSNLARSDRGQTSTPQIINIEGGQDPPTNGANSTAPIAPPLPASTAPPAPSAEAAPTVAPHHRTTYRMSHRYWANFST